MLLSLCRDISGTCKSNQLPTYLGSHWYVSVQAVSKGKHSDKNLVALFGHGQGTSHGLSMMYVNCTSLCTTCATITCICKPGSQFDVRAASVVSITGKSIFH